MSTVLNAKEEALTHFLAGHILAALRLYDAVVSAHPLDFHARLRVADCCALLGENSAACTLFQRVGEYAIRAGHPLTAVVAAKLLQANDGDSEPLFGFLAKTYGLESTMIGEFAARLRLPEETAPVALPNLTEPVANTFVTQAASRATTCLDGFDEYPAAVHPIPLLSKLREDVLLSVLNTLVVHRLAAGQYAIRQGETGRSFFFVASGNVRIFDTDGSEDERTLAHLGENALFGEMALLGNHPRTASAMAETETELVEVTCESLAALANDLTSVATTLRDFTRERLLGNLMAHSPLFTPFTPVQRRDLLQHFTEHDIASGTPVIHEGEPGKGLFVLLSGELEVSKDGESLAHLSSGAVFGEISLVRGINTTATVCSSAPSTLLFLARKHVDHIASGVPRIRQYLESLADNRELDTRLTLGRAETEDGAIDILF